MRFQVPQFIDIEDKIFGPFTFKQFIYIAGGAGICFVIYNSLPFFIAVLLIIPVGVFAGALAFYKVNNQPFINVVESYIGYAFQSKLYIWKKAPKKKETKKELIAPVSTIPKLSGSRLKDIAWSLDVLDITKKDQQ